MTKTRISVSVVGIKLERSFKSFSCLPEQSGASVLNALFVEAFGFGECLGSYDRSFRTFRNQVGLLGVAGNETRFWREVRLTNQSESLRATKDEGDAKKERLKHR